MTMRAFISGTAGFIGFHLAKSLLDSGWTVTGYDGMTDYYDVRLKQARHDILSEHEGFTPVVGLLEDQAALDAAVDDCAPEIIVHLAGQAGVRYSLENPRSYLDANVIGTFNVMEAARRHAVRHLLMASTSSVYGANKEMPYRENAQTDGPLTIYAATKKATEVMAHSYAHLHGLPTTMFRFFTVYGPWGRPDMALFKFTRGILEGTPIDIYNHGDMFRDFTYVDDLVRAIVGLISVPPELPADRGDLSVAHDTLSPIAPWRVVNVGNSDKVRLMEFVEAIEAEIGRPAIRNMKEMQPGDVPATWADATLLQELTGYRPSTDFREGIARFVRWYREYYSV